MKTKTIRQTVIFSATPDIVYEMLMDSAKHATFTGDEAHINREVGGRFIAYGDYIEGTNLELVPGEKIVQSWRASDWPEGHYSKVTFSLEPVDHGTRLTFIQTDVPDEFSEDIGQGWHDYYWTPMREMVESEGK
jgi:activator of HSP90 ATPase